MTPSCLQIGIQKRKLFHVYKCSSYLFYNKSRNNYCEIILILRTTTIHKNQCCKFENQYVQLSSSLSRMCVKTAKVYFIPFYDLSTLLNNFFLIIHKFMAKKKKKNAEIKCLQEEKKKNHDKQQYCNPGCYCIKS